MSLFRVSLVTLLCCAVLAPSAAAAKAKATPAASHGTSSHKKKKAKPRKPRGQQAMEAGRIAEIQQALIREHYLRGEANGKWDAASQAAMQKYQADNGWQTRLLPDSRAIKKLGLGPDYSNAINAKESSFVPPAPASTIPPDQAEGFAEAAGVKR